MSVVKINAIEVPEGAGEELEARFAARAGAVENSPGFEQFMLMRPVEGDTRYFVLTQWESEEAFQDWMSSRDFAKGHANAGADSQGAGDHPGGHRGGQPGEASGPPPASTGSSLLGFEVVEQIPRSGS